MPTENPASLSLLSDEIVFCLFKGKVLVGRCVCKCLRDRLWSAGTASEPVFLRVQPIVRISTRNLASELTFLKSFRHVNVLISTSRNSFESRALFKILKTNFAICTIQEQTRKRLQPNAVFTAPNIFVSVIGGSAICMTVKYARDRLSAGIAFRYSSEDN